MVSGHLKRDGVLKQFDEVETKLSLTCEKDTALAQSLEIIDGSSMVVVLLWGSETRAIDAVLSSAEAKICSMPELSFSPLDRRPVQLCIHLLKNICHLILGLELELLITKRPT